MKAAATPQLDQTMDLTDGRTLAFSEWGDLAGRPVVLLHGMPGSRLMCPDLDTTEAAGVRLITIDRPGYGRSDPKIDRTLSSWVDDFVELAGHLDLPPCPVVGWSSGGLYALACAYHLPDRVSMVGLAGSPGLALEVPGALDEFSPEGQSVVRLFHEDRAQGIAAVTRLCQRYDGEGLYLPQRFRASQVTSRSGQTHFMVSSGDADDRLLAQPGLFATIGTWLDEGARQGTAGLIADWIARIDDSGFSVAAIQQEVVVMIGGTDRQVRRFHADYLAATIPRAKLVSYPGEGHLFLFDHWDEMLTALA